MSVPEQSDFISREQERMHAENLRRKLEINPDTYAHWQPAEIFMRAGRKLTAPLMLQRAGAFPAPGDQCLEIGFGSLGWLGDLISWGVRESDIHGIELEPNRVALAREILPSADLRVGDAAALPWNNDTFKLVISSIVFTSILDANVRRIVADEITRVLKPGGALLWWDFAVNNPGNPHVHKVGRRELKRLFPRLEGQVKSVTLAPPLARLVAPRSWALAALLESVPLLRTHLLAVLIKQ